MTLTDILKNLVAGRRLSSNAGHGTSDALRREKEKKADQSRARSGARIVYLMLFFWVGMATIFYKTVSIAVTELPAVQKAARAAKISNYRAEITDRDGRVMAMNMKVRSVYTQTADVIDPIGTARKLVRIFPDMDYDRLVKLLSQPGRFAWIRDEASPEQAQAVHDIGDPGIVLGSFERRFYPNGALAAHVLGGVKYNEKSTSAAKMIGLGGVERYFNAELGDPQDSTLKLALDLRVQHAVEEALAIGGMGLMNAKGASAVLMDVHTGEIISLASLPDFDPNKRPAPAVSGDPSASPLFDRSVQGMYELGSTFKIFPVAQALELGLVTPDTVVKTWPPIKAGGFTIRDSHDFGRKNTVTRIIEKSINVGTANIARMVGGDRQKQFLEALGMTERVALELPESASAMPLVPKKWIEPFNLTVSYGYGIAVSPVHLATAYATLANGGFKVEPTLMYRDSVPQNRTRILSARSSSQAVKMMREVVLSGTAQSGFFGGYDVAGKTGTANKLSAQGGYDSDRTISTFASVFPAHDPRYVLVVSLDEPALQSGDDQRRAAGSTAVPVASQIITRVGPLLGLVPNSALNTSATGGN